MAHRKLNTLTFALGALFFVALSTLAHHMGAASPLWDIFDIASLALCIPFTASLWAMLTAWNGDVQ